MKKLLSIAIAAAVAAPMAVSAETTIYGRLNQNLVMTDNGTTDDWDIEQNASRFGVKGDEDLGNGLKAIFQYEWSVDSSDAGTLGGRLAYAGLSGGFGTVAIGRQWTPYYGSVDKTDINQVNGMNDTYIGSVRVGNALAYVSPNFNGFSAKLALVIDEGGAEDLNDDFNDWTNLSLDYANGPLSVGVSYLAANGSTAATDGSMWGIGAKYSFGNFALFGQYEDADFQIYNLNVTGGAETADVDEFAIGAEAYFGNNTVRIKYGEVDKAADVEHWALGVQHNFSKRTMVFAEYENTDTQGAADVDRFGIGLRHDF